MDPRPYPSTILFGRHAQSVGNTLTREERAQRPQGTNLYELTERGREQARITGEWLRERYPEPDAIIRSYYTRTRETADLLYPGRLITEDARLAEANRGIWHVRSEAQIAREAPWELDRRAFEGLYHYRPIGGENWPDVEARVRPFRHSLRWRFPGKTVVVVTHGQWLLVWQKLVHHWTIEDVIRRYQQEEVVANASVLIYHGDVEPKTGKYILRHDPATDYIVPWQGKI